ncbi:MAG: SUMF1/EgtB/PvdO family nonheme iron enzyme [Planctomycetes bacterium]|nr:SUMF1/EgtB/PvdO family nonheme iron enzyme [Planctomycetota bacterium]
MQSISLRATALLSLSLGSFGPLLAQNEPGSNATALPGAGKPQATNSGDGLPTFLLEVPGGDVWMGLDVEQFVQAVAEATFEMKPEKAFEIAPEKFVKTMARSAPALSRDKVHVDTFLLGKWPVRNDEYEVLVNAERAAGRKIKVPFLWWIEGRKDDYESKLDDIRKAFPKDPRGGVEYWERHGDELPGALKDKDGKPIGELPVVYVSWRDANRFAASVGMRLPTEAELTRAMRGDGENVWPVQDHYDSNLLRALRMFNGQDQHLKPVGSVQAATGPYGHFDMFGQVFQLCSDLGYLPLHGNDDYNKTWDKLQKNKLGKMLTAKPPFDYIHTPVKGGCFLSFQQPEGLMIDARVRVQTSDVLESVGFRLAKSTTPGYDYLLSLKRIKFSSSVFEKDQDLDLAALVGAERYTLAANGFPSKYEAVSFAPVNWLSSDKRARLDQMLEGSQEKPLLIGGLAATAAFGCGAEPGLYALFYRDAGIPKDLQEAVKRGHKQITKELKEAEKNKGKEKESDKKDDEKADKQEKNEQWRTVVKRFGLTDEDLADASAADGDVGFVRIDGVKIDTTRSAFLLATDGKIVAALPGTKHKPTAGPAAAATMVIEAGTKEQKDKAVAKLTFSIPLIAGKEQKAVGFELHVGLDQEPPTAETPWRLPMQGAEKK